MEERQMTDPFGVFLVFVLLYLCVHCHSVVCFSSADQVFPVKDIVAKLEASTDAPGLVNAPVGFHVKLVGPQDNSSVYDYTFEAHLHRTRYSGKHAEDDVDKNAQKRRWVLKNESLECNALFAFDEAGEYDMKIMVMTDTALTPIAKTNVKFTISSNILGSIQVEQPGIHPPIPSIVSTKTEALISFVLYDPHDFLNGTVQMFGWSLDGRPPEVSGSSIRYNFTDAVDYTVMLMVTFINNTDPRISYFGAYSLRLKARDPIDNFNVSGLTSIKHGDLLELELSCEGSPPYSYCWRFTHETVNVTNQTCVYPTVTTDCEFLVIRYFRKSGNYKLVVVLENEVMHTVDVVNINVFDSAAEPQLSPIIVPLVCCCLALVIVVMALMYYVHTRRQHSIEVADFDFQQSDSYEFRTFYQRVRDSLHGFCSPPRKERRYSYTLIHAQVT